MKKMFGHFMFWVMVSALFYDTHYMGLSMGAGTIAVILLCAMFLEYMSTGSITELK